MADRRIDWRAFLDRLKFCYGCGRFGLPTGNRVPANWKVLYQPHQDAPPALLVCSSACFEEVRGAIAKGPVRQPLRVATDVMMPAELRETMISEAMQHAIDSGRADDLFLAALDGDDEG